MQNRKVYKEQDFRFNYKNFSEYADYALRVSSKNYSEQDIIYSLSKNLDDQVDDDQGSLTAQHDIIGLSSIYLPHDNYDIDKEFPNLYNCTKYNRKSRFHENKSQITFFENKKLNNGDNFLATSNGDLQYINIWDIYNLRSVQNIYSKSDNRPDYYIEMPKGSQLQNMTWNSQQDELIYSTYNEKAERQYICKQDFSEKYMSSIDIGKISTQSPGQGLLLENQSYVNVTHKISYFSIFEQNSNQLIGTGNGKQFIIDIRNPQSIRYFGKDDNFGPHNDLLVEFNQKDKIIILNRQGSNIKVYDIRKDNTEILDITFENSVQKIEFDPFNPNQFVILFESYFTKVNTKISDFQSYWFQDQNMLDFCHNSKEPFEFLSAGQINTSEGKKLGILSLNKMTQ